MSSIRVPSEISRIAEATTSGGEGSFSRVIYGTAGSLAIPGDRTGHPLRLTAQDASAPLSDADLLALAVDFQVSREQQDDSISWIVTVRYSTDIGPSGPDYRLMFGGTQFGQCFIHHIQLLFVLRMRNIHHMQ